MQGAGGRLVHDKLYRDYQLRKQKADEARRAKQAMEDRELTFKPRITHRSSTDMAAAAAALYEAVGQTWCPHWLLL